MEGKKVKRVAKVMSYDKNKPDDLREYEMLKSVKQEHIVQVWNICVCYLHLKHIGLKQYIALETLLQCE